MIDRETGMQEDREGIFDTIIRNKSHYQKRAYQCIKCLVTLFSSCSVAHNLLRSTPDFKSKWSAAVTWLQEELDRRPFGSSGNQYNYNWSPPAPSNDTSNGYYLERSQSARITLSKAVTLIPEAEKEEQEETLSEEPESPAGSSSLSSSQSQVTVFEDKDHSRSEADQRLVEVPFVLPSRELSEDKSMKEGDGSYHLNPSRQRTAREIRRSDRRMALRSELCDPQSGPIGLPGLPIRAPSPIPPASDWSQPSSSSASTAQLYKDFEKKIMAAKEKQKMSSNTWWEKSLESEGRDDVEEVEEVSDK